MKAEIIAVGSELLLGDVINSNAAWISKRLAAMGVDVYYHVTVGDNPTRINKVIQQALVRSDILIFTGGLGPTDDDLTVPTIANFFGVPLIHDPESEQMIRDFFVVRGMPMSPSNLKQAMKPQGAETIKNPIGTAPGIAWNLAELTGKTTLILTFPGVPKELYAMWDGGERFIRQQLSRNGETPMVLRSESLHFFGIGESKIGEQLRDLMESSNPTVAPYVGRAEVRIRIAAKAEDPMAAHQLIEPIKVEILRRCGEYYVGENDIPLEFYVAELLRENGLSVSVAESCTGGLVSSRLTDVPGSSDYTFLNVVTYSNIQKHKLLGVSSVTLEKQGAVSRETASEMAFGVKKLSGCDIGLSLTGIAGPAGGSEEKPVGLVYIGLCGENCVSSEEAITKKVLVNPNYSRSDIKHWFSQYALLFLKQHLEGTLQPDI